MKMSPYLKSVWTSCLLFAAACVFAAETKPVAPAPAATVMAGQVLEIKHVQRYTFLRLRTDRGETWAAVPATGTIRKGSKVTIDNVTVMKNYQSPELKKTFATIAFGSVGQGERPGGGNAMVAAHTGVVPAQDPAVRVARANALNARTVAEVLANPVAFKDKPVVIRGKVVKYNPGIMGKNWIHLQDGTGSAAAKTNDLLVTTTEPASVGDVVTVKGVLHTDKDFSLGYSYKALVEEATLQR